MAIGYRPLTFRQKAQIAWMAVRHPGTSPVAKGVLVAALIYGVAPVDLLPDLAPLIGMLDDVLVAATAVAMFLRWTQAIRSRIAREHGL